MENNEKAIQLKDEKLQDVNGGNEFDVKFTPTETPAFPGFPDIPEEEWKKIQQSLVSCAPYYTAGTGIDPSAPHCSQPDKTGTLEFCKDCPYMKWAMQNK